MVIRKGSSIPLAKIYAITGQPPAKCYWSARITPHATRAPALPAGWLE